MNTQTLFQVDRTILLIALVYTVLLVIYQWSTFSISWSLDEYERRYANSQYVLGNARTEILGDGDIYTYAGIRYVQGEDVTAINFEHTPLIKYLYGISYLLTGKPNWVLVPLIILSILVFWHLSELLIQPIWGRYLALALYVGHSAMYTNMVQTLLDFPMTVFLLLTTAAYVSLAHMRTYKVALIFGGFAGLYLLSKYPVPLSLLYVLFMLGNLLHLGLARRLVFLSAITMLMVYLLGYSSYFLHGHTLFDFVRFEWWRWQWFSSKTDNPSGMIWQTLFLGKYPKWWEYSGEYIEISYWNWLWPLSFIAYIGSWFSKMSNNNILLPYQLWILISMLVYSLGAAEDRFLVPLIPGIALYGALCIVNIAPRVKSLFS